MTPDSPEGTNAIVMGVSEAPSWPEAGAGMASGSGLQTGGMGVGTTVGAWVAVGGTAVGGTGVGKASGAAVATVAGGIAAVGTAVAAAPHALSSMAAASRIETNKNIFFMTLSPL